MSGTRYYIDGYNVMHQSSTLRPIARENLERAREALVDKVAQFCIATTQEAFIVFDGRSPQQAELVNHYRGVERLHVLYAPGHTSADAEIERRVYKERDRLRVVVVSNDRGLRDLCRGMGALTMDADNFLASARETRTEMQQDLARTRKESPAFLEDSLDSDAVAKLKALRNKLK